MGYLHVVSLRYRFIPEVWARFPDPGPVERYTPSFYIRLENDIVNVWMKEHHSTVDSAREKVEGYLRRWEVLSALHNGRRLMHFECERVEVLDLEEPFSCTLVKPVEASFDLRRVVSKSHDRYPGLPDDFALSPDVEVMWSLYEGYLQRQDRLLPMAYTCLTRFTYSVGSDKQLAAKKYGISRKILTKLADLSTSGDEETARKWVPGRSPKALTDQENVWVEEAVRVLILRAGQYAADPNKAWPQITKAHLPMLPDEKQ